MQPLVRSGDACGNRAVPRSWLRALIKPAKVRLRKAYPQDIQWLSASYPQPDG